MDKKKQLQATVNFDNTPELFVALEQMRVQDMLQRSQFIKKLIRDELSRRAMETVQSGKSTKGQRQ